MTANRRIFLNIVATYGRSLYALVIGLFCGRWTLMALGQTDYGILGLVGGLTAFISYFNGILGGAIGRFYAVAVGREITDPDNGLAECHMWFTTAVVINTLIPIALMSIGYPLGEYTVRHWLVMPPDRVAEAIWVWRFVCVSCFLGMVSVPMNAMYGAKQYIAELTIYSFITTTLNALFLYYMITHPGMWMTRLAFWQCLLGITPNAIIAIRAFYIFPECRFKWKYVNCLRSIRKMCGYALWNAWGTLGALLRDNGSNVLINVNFGPKVNAGSAVGGSLSGNCNMLSGCMIGAFSPAIYNAWGAGQFDRARMLAHQTCKFGTLLVLVFAIPLCLEVDEVLLIWLKNPPAYAAGFCIYVLVMNVIDKLAVGHMLVVNANGKVALYQAFLGTSLVMTLLIAWVLVQMNLGPYSIGMAMVLTMCFCATGRVWFARILVGMSAWYWVKRIAIPVVFVVSLSIAVGCLPRFFMVPSFMRVVVTTLVVELVLISMSWFVALDATEKAYVREKFRSMLLKVKVGSHA